MPRVSHAPWLLLGECCCVTFSIVFSYTPHFIVLKILLERHYAFKPNDNTDFNKHLLARDAVHYNHTVYVVTSEFLGAKQSESRQKDNFVSEHINTGILYLFETWMHLKIMINVHNFVPKTIKIVFSAWLCELGISTLCAVCSCSHQCDQISLYRKVVILAQNTA